MKTDLSSALATQNFYKKEVIWSIWIRNVYKSLILKKNNLLIRSKK